MSTTRRSDIAGLMARFRRGDSVAAGELVTAFYPELKRMAAAQMRAERQEHTWQATVLVHEMYLRLVRIKALRPAAGADGEEEKAMFFGMAGHLMRQLLIEHARPLSKRVARTGRASADDLEEIANPKDTGAQAIVEVEDALNRLGSIDSRLRAVVEMRVFEGLTGVETAERMACAPATVARYWNFARNWLAHELA